MQSIITKTMGPTDTKGERVKASAYAGSVVTQWDYSMSAADNHRAAARALAVRFGWDDRFAVWVGGQLASGEWVWVDVNGPSLRVGVAP